MLVIWRATCEYIKEQFCKYKGINIRGFGAFTYEVHQTLPRLGIDFNQAKKKLLMNYYLKKNQDI
jgi:nucleoid DNA-binding protein